ncbi:hypothetical protein COCMIDRAFT_34656 [Bipolaris oryzae ATCC 44560]|uniref:Uncharacterized protein n=1 Tax=Bipolaris oryzae ATCC 44560 TaxID=930090 RepID=W6ZD63_COCMI|nr:uncharacterized protein COCMIDRAFT_34656 [Bipolaris oryzae ATCC 44560]EUC47920.1 hypothetical protein COCMIDRAFT_34656 [Bipolaris oryzae ATCC 44560]
MDPSIIFRQLLRMPAAHRNALLQPTRPHMRAFAAYTQPLPQPRYLSVPRIVQPSFWASLTPKPFKTRSETPRSKEWNPATPYIILGLLVGSQAIQILWLKQERNHDLRRAEAKIGILREVIERVQRGEKVDVEGALGTSNAVEEREWKQVLKDIQDEEALFQSKKKRRAMREAALQEEAAEKKTGQESTKSQDAAKMQVESVGGVKFY